MCSSPSSHTWSAACQFTSIPHPPETLLVQHANTHATNAHTHAHTSAWPQLAPPGATKKRQRDRGTERRRVRKSPEPRPRKRCRTQGNAGSLFSGKHTLCTWFGGSALLETRLGDSALAKVKVGDAGKGHAAPTEIGAVGVAVPPGLGMPGM